MRFLRMIRAALLSALLIAPGLAFAQDQRQLDQRPATSAQLPPSEPPGQSRPGPGAPGTAGSGPDGTAQGRPDRVGIQERGERRTEPPAGHQVLGGPPVPGAVQPQRSEGFATGRDPIPERPGARPDAPTTDTGQIREGGGARR